MKICFSQNREDIVLWRALDGIVGGTYIEVGANHPKHASVSRSFYDAGWSGLLIEPSPEWHDLIRAERPRDVFVGLAASEKKGTTKFTQVEGTGYSSSKIDPLVSKFDRSLRVVEIEVHTDRLDNIVSDYLPGVDQVHFMLIDVEGAESEVLKGFSFTEVRPWILVVESTLPDSTVQNHAEWEYLLQEANYEFCLFDGLNRFYVAVEHADLRPLLSYPACVLDKGFLMADTVYLESRLAESESRLAESESRLAESESRLAESESRLAESESRLAESESRLAESESRLAESERNKRRIFYKFF